MITDSEFAKLTKTYFMAILAYRIEKLLRERPHMKVVNLVSQDLSSEDRRRATAFIDHAWLQHIDATGL